MPLISMHDGRHRPRGMTEGKIELLSFLILSVDPKSITAIVAGTSLGKATISSYLSDLKMEGYVSAAPGREIVNGRPLTVFSITAKGKIAHATGPVTPKFSDQRPTKLSLETLLNNTPNSVFDMARFAGGSI